MATTFLTAEWRKLVMANYAIDKKVLLPYLPAKTELDLWNNNCYVSLVGFRFQDVKLRGFSIPLHTNFEEVNLRFYVRHKSSEGWKRGVVFISEIVPRRAITFVANTLYGEKYATMPMAYSWAENEDALTVSYKWKKRKWNELKVTTSINPLAIAEGSEEEFITEHYWGYAKLKNNGTNEYEVAHPRWEVYQTKEHHIDVDFKNIYGEDFQLLQQEKPASVFLAEGSAVSVKAGRKI
ncbi:DUF2071 domain-containing protein [Ilyomonas limi]|uniref:DUF2071 domain-containing protein n=1 Tax=Ilyomonas limi TaxID=2575867 RepID=A0A4U3L8S8_9BACT|nr:DUF2071 domain-containing protein [Ilyomonas limi]TKK71480.1 DUF2071 domain-containing protein [Ilyomonas limi]